MNQMILSIFEKMSNFEKKYKSFDPFCMGKTKNIATTKNIFPTTKKVFPTTNKIFPTTNKIFPTTKKVFPTTKKTHFSFVVGLFMSFLL